MFIDGAFGIEGGLLGKLFFILLELLLLELVVGSDGFEVGVDGPLLEEPIFPKRPEAPPRFDLLLPNLTKPKVPFFVPYPDFTKRFSFLAVECFARETIRPCLFCIKLDFVRPPEVLNAVPCHTCARVPINISKFLPFTL